MKRLYQNWISYKSFRFIFCASCLTGSDLIKKIKVVQTNMGHSSIFTRNSLTSKNKIVKFNRPNWTAHVICMLMSAFIKNVIRLYSL